MWRRTFAAGLTLGLALLLSACGPTGASTTPTPTPKPTATPIPACTTWNLIPSPTPTRYPYSGLTAVSALSATDAWAVGTNYPDEGSGAAATLIERWDGSAWHIVASPGEVFLKGMAAVSANDIWVVGGWIGGLERGPGSPMGRIDVMMEHWNGSQWNVVPAANPSADANSLTGMAARTTNEIWAVGEYINAANVIVPLIERWNGSAWQVVASAVPNGVSASSLTAVNTVPGSNQLWAVGSVRYNVPPSGGPGYSQPLTERWDGGAWQVVASPTLPSGALAGELNSVVALSATDAWAVGDYTASDHSVRTLIAHWDGATWRTVTSPDIMGSLAGVAAIGPQDARAVGYLISGNGGGRSPVIEQWNGSTWVVTSSPMPQDAGSAGFGAVVTDGAGGYWAVGNYSHPSAIVSDTLIARCS